MRIIIYIEELSTRIYSLILVIRRYDSKWLVTHKSSSLQLSNWSWKTPKRLRGWKTTAGIDRFRSTISPATYPITSLIFYSGIMACGRIASVILWDQLLTEISRKNVKTPQNNKNYKSGGYVMSEVRLEFTKCLRSLQNVKIEVFLLLMAVHLIPAVIRCFWSRGAFDSSLTDHVFNNITYKHTKVNLRKTIWEELKKKVIWKEIW